MLELVKNKKYLIITTDFFRANISMSHGGTLRKLCSKNFDTGLKREGCEYWKSGKIHYEQEFGRVINLKVKEYKNSINIDVNVKMRAPSGEFEGECFSKYIFKNSKINIKSMVSPEGDIRCSDKYVCFDRDAFTGYCIDDKYFDMPKNNFKAEFEVKDIKLIKGERNLYIKSPDASIRMYKTRSMIEIKPNWPLDRINKYMCMEFAWEK